MPKFLLNSLWCSDLSVNYLPSPLVRPFWSVGYKSNHAIKKHTNHHPRIGNCAGVFGRTRRVVGTVIYKRRKSV